MFMTLCHPVTRICSVCCLCTLLREPGPTHRLASASSSSYSTGAFTTMDEASRRLAVLERQCCAGPGPSSSSQSSSYASATASPSSYARVHGQVSREPARWREIQVVAKERLEEVKYAKSDEGIAKVVNAVMSCCRWQ